MSAVKADDQEIFSLLKKVAHTQKATISLVEKYTRDSKKFLELLLSNDSQVSLNIHVLALWFMVLIIISEG